MSLPLRKYFQPLRKRFYLLSGATLLITATSLSLAIGPGRAINSMHRKIERAVMIYNSELIDVGSHYLRIDRKGSGGPTVVFDSGLSQSKETWGGIPDEVAKWSEVIVYDRAGVGQSDPGPTPRTSQLIVEDLHNLLIAAGAPKPYILAGHSFGGMNVRLFATRYPDEVGGLVLIDASCEDQFTRYAELMPLEERIRYLRHERGENDENANMIASARQVQTAGRLKSMPVIILTAGDPGQAKKDEQQEMAHQEMQKSLARLIPGSRQIIAEKSGHFIHKDQPDLVIKSIIEMVKAVRQKDRLK